MKGLHRALQRVHSLCPLVCLSRQSVLSCESCPPQRRSGTDSTLVRSVTVSEEPTLWRFFHFAPPLQRFIMILTEHLVRCETDGTSVLTPWYKNCIERLQQIFLQVCGKLWLANKTSLFSATKKFHFLKSSNLSRYVIPISSLIHVHLFLLAHQNI